VFDLSSNCESTLNKQSTGGAEPLPLSDAQRGIWFAHQIDPTRAAYNIGEYIELRGPLDPSIFERALRQVVSESETLHLQFSERAGVPFQTLAPPHSWSLPIIDVSGEPDARAAAEALMRADLARAVDLTRDPLFSFALFKVPDERFFWFARYHHIVMDGFAMWLVARRVADVYTRLCDGLSPPRRSAASRLYWPKMRPIARPGRWRRIARTGPTPSRRGRIPTIRRTAAVRRRERTFCAKRRICPGPWWIACARWRNTRVSISPG